MEASASSPPRSSESAAPGADWLKMLGGVAFGVGALVLFIRKSGVGGSADWAEFPRLLIVAIPCGLLFGLGAAQRGVGSVERWRAVLMVTGVLLAPVALEQLRSTLNIDASYNFPHFVIFTAVVALAAYASFIIGASYQALLAGIAGILAWLFFWNWILVNPGVNAYRWLLILLGLGFLAAALGLKASNMSQGDELVTVAAVVGVLVGVLGVSQALRGLSTPFATTGHGQGFFWNLLLLVVSLAAIGYAARNQVRGPAYIGFIGLAAFAGLIGFQVNSLLKGEAPSGAFVGWPLTLLLIGGAALALGVVADRQINR